MMLPVISIYLKNLMKTIVVIFLLCIFFNTNLLSQEWKFIGGPSGIYPNDILITYEGRLLCSCWYGIYYSDNYGDEWTFNNSTSNYGGFYNLTQRLNGQIIAGCGNGIAVSTDDGMSWEIVYNQDALYDYGIRVYESPSDSSLYFSQYQTLFKSTDNGITWDSIWTGNVIDGMVITNSGYIYMGVRDTGLMNSTDNGETFSRIDFGYQTTDALLTDFYANRTGGIYFVYQSFDTYIIYYENGFKWRIVVGNFDVPLGTKINGDLIYKNGNCIKGFSFVNRYSYPISCQNFVKDQFARSIHTKGDTWIANFSYAGLYKSTNGGYVWSDINTGLGYEQCLSLELTDSGNLLVGAFGGAFWGKMGETTDLGQTWTYPNPGNKDAIFVDISKLKNSEIIASGTYGVFIRDSDRNHWRISGNISNVYSQFVGSDGTVYIGNDDNGIYISTDNGFTWHEANNGNNNAYIFGFGEGLQGRVFASAWGEGTYYSDDRGGHWNYLNSGIISYLQTYDFKSWQDTVYAAASGGLLYSTNNGINWDFIPGFYGSIKKIAITENGDILAGTYSQGVYKCPGDKRTMEPFNSGIENRMISDITIDSDKQIYIASDSGVFISDYYLLHPALISPENNAANLPLQLELQWASVPYANNYELKVASDSLFSSIVVHRPDLTDKNYSIGPLKYNTKYYWQITAKKDLLKVESPVFNFTTLAPDFYILEQNYPNPFNSGTNIEFYVPVQSRILISIYDILGRLVKVIMNEDMPPGTKVYDWEPHDLASGIYFIKMESGEFSQIKKALLIK